MLKQLCNFNMLNKYFSLYLCFMMTDCGKRVTHVNVSFYLICSYSLHANLRFICFLRVLFKKLMFSVNMNSCFGRTKVNWFVRYGIMLSQGKKLLVNISFFFKIVDVVIVTYFKQENHLK